MKLVITEKPSVANNIASALFGNNGASRKEGYLIGNDYIITWCYGHLISLAQPDVYDEKYSAWNYEQLPIIPEEWLTIINPDTLQQYNVISSLMHDERVSSIIIATDPGREGELIARYVYNRCECTKPLERLWTASLEDEAIRQGFKDLQPGKKYDSLYKAAFCRAKSDWLIGMNLTRLFSVIYKANGKGKTLNVGRVLTPTLAMIVNRENEINNFVKKPFYNVIISSDNGLTLKSERIDEKEVAEVLSDMCKDKEITIKDVIDENKSISQPLLYDLTSLQRDANRLFSYSAKETSDIAQDLYEKKLITYPRTDSRYLTEDMESTVLEVLEIAYAKSEIEKKVENPNIKRNMDSSKVTDHHAIICTKTLKDFDITSLTVGEKKILELVMTRLIAAVAPKHTFKATKILAECEDKEFSATGKVVIDEGFKEYEKILRAKLKAEAEEKKEDDEELTLPSVLKGQTFSVNESSVKEGSTQPPKHYTEDTLLAAMERAGADEMEDDVERKGLGTTATRAEIINHLFDYNFCTKEKKNIISTEKGNNLIAVLPDVIKTPSITAEWENKLAEIAKDEFDPDDFMEGIETLIKTLVTEFKEPDEAFKDLFTSSKEQEVLGKCPNCGEDVISGPHGAYCSKRCGMKFGYAFGVKLSASQVKSLLEDKKTVVKGCKTKDGKSFNANLIPKGIKPYEDGFVYDFEMVRDALGSCPNCGADVMTGEYGAYCSKRCGMKFGYVFGVKPTTAQVKSLLANKKTLINGCKNKEGKVFDAYFTPKGIKPYNDSFVWDFSMEFPKKDK